MTATLYEIYELNTILRTEFNKVIKELPQIQLKGEIIEIKVFKNNSGLTFKIKQDDSEFYCKAWQRKNIDINKIIACENTSCIVTGKLVQDNFGNGYRFILDIDEDIIKESDESKIKKLKEICEQREYFKNKKEIKWNNIRNIGLISKADTQGYTDFIEQFKFPINICLKQIILEGENTEESLINAINEFQEENFDIIMIIRGGGCTSDISSSFDKLSIYECMKSSKIPIVTAIGHQADKDEKLLITCISDYNFPTPTSAALELNKIIQQPVLNKLNELCNIIENKFYENLNKKRNSKYYKLEAYYDKEIANKFGGHIIDLSKLDGNNNNKFIITLHSDGNCYKTEINMNNKITINKNDIELKIELDEAIKSQDIDFIESNIHSLINKNQSIKESILKIKELDETEDKFKDTIGREYKTIHCKYDYSNLNTNNENFKKLIQVYANTLYYIDILSNHNDKEEIKKVYNYLCE